MHAVLFLFLICIYLHSGLGSNNLDFYSHTVMDIRGNIVSLNKYRGKVSLVVNVASECGYTEHHYQSLVRLQQILGPTGKFNVLAFPCNQFGNQEPKSDAAIYKFAKKTYKVNFPMFAKVNVKGQDASDAWTYLIENSKNMPTWNFFKYLVDHNGNVLHSWGPGSDPDKLFNVISNAVDAAVEADGKSKKRSKSEL